MKSTHIGRQCLPYLDIGLDRPMSPTILFLHGWGVSPWAYRGMLDILAREHRVVAPLLPALTWNRSRTPIKSHRDWADLVARFCAQMGIEAAHVVGQSTGGGVAACLAAAHPGLTRSLTLIDASGAPEHVAKYLINAAIFDIAIHLFDLRHVVAQSRLAASFLVNLAGAREQLILAAYIPLDEDLASDYAAISAPTQFLWGAKDVLFPLAAARHLQALVPGAALHQLEPGYHLWELKRPEIAAGLVLRFVAAHG